METKNDFFGIDASNEISLNEYGLLVKPYTKDGRQDEYFCIYKICNGFDCGYITEEAINGYVQCKEFMDDEKTESFLDFLGTDKDEWLECNFVTKLHDLITYWGVENIMGSTYYPLTEEDVQNLIEKK